MLKYVEETIKNNNLQVEFDNMSKIALEMTLTPGSKFINNSYQTLIAAQLYANQH